MRVFELYFNPKKKRDSIFGSFSYEPTNDQEKSSGSLCMAGEVSKAMPQNSNFLEVLSDIIKDQFFAKANIFESLKGANAFLDQEAKSGNVNWLGNLNFAVINIKDSVLNFTKVGDIKILLLREGEVLDISQNLELQDQEPYPLKVFSNIASGKLSSQDRILIATQEVFSVISTNDVILNQLSQVSKEKELDNIFRQNKEIVSDVSGVCLLVADGSAPSFPALPNFRFAPKIVSKKVILISCLILILAVAYFLFEGNKQVSPIQTESGLGEVRYKIMMAENFLIMKKEEKAQALFQEAWDSLRYVDTEEASSLRESIKKYIILTQP